LEPATNNRPIAAAFTGGAAQDGAYQEKQKPRIRMERRRERADRVSAGEDDPPPPEAGRAEAAARTRFQPRRRMTQARRIALVVGDTRGHFYPALAVAEAFQSRAGDADIVFFGPRGLGADLAARDGFPYRAVSGSPLARVGPLARAAAAGRTLTGIAQARRALGALGTNLVMGFGAYASGAVVLAARTLGVPAVIHEANVHPGLANRLLALVADRIYLNHAAAGSRFPPHRLRVTGWPVRAAVRALADLPRGLPGRTRPARILVCSGSRGGAFLARQAPGLLARVVAEGRALEVRHQSADADPASIGDAYARAGIAARVSPFIDDFPACYRWADLVIARAGAGTVAELAVAGLPSLLVPLADAADDHQRGNASRFGAEGAARWTSERDWDAAALAAWLTHVLGDPATWSALSASARRLAVPDAADAVVDDCERFMRDRW
jgi:UDP-N-acetylglucosamine--N-acetylmuramyl-(pentapeptide) pyrophosphoryl-undecaprenol N-acetylglucosamine transferase